MNRQAALKVIHENDVWRHGWTAGFINWHIERYGEYCDHKGMLHLWPYPCPYDKNTQNYGWWQWGYEAGIESAIVNLEG